MTARRPVACGRGNCDCTNITIMQLFHELKQQYPAVSDEVVSACINDHCHNRPACRARLERELCQLPRALAYPPSLMGARMTESVHKFDNERARPSAFPSPLATNFNHLQSHSSPTSSSTPSKPPISPSSSNKRFSVTKNSPTKPKNIYNKFEKETLPNSVSPNDFHKNTNLGAVKRPPAVRPASLDLPKQLDPPQRSVNLSVNFNCSVDVLATPPRSRKHSVLQITPEPVWCQQTLTSPRSYTSVNLTLRTPTSEPLPPIDICSANSSLTYSTSSFNSKHGLQSRLQITVGPAGVGNVTAIRSRPSSSYHPEPENLKLTTLRAESMPDLATSITPDTNKNTVLVNRQLKRKEQLRIELEAEKERLMTIRKEVTALRVENTIEFKDKLKREIRHLQAQCDMLTQQVDRRSDTRVPLGETNVEYYRHIYPDRHNPFSPRVLPSEAALPEAEPVEMDEQRWPCHICTFRNHPLMNKCEQCEMPRILLGNLNNNIETKSSNTVLA